MIGENGVCWLPAGTAAGGLGLSGRGGSEGDAERGSGNAAEHGCHFLAAERLVPMEGAEFIHSGQDARIVEGQHLLVVGIGQGGDGA